MKYIKKYETSKESMEEKIELLNDLILENPLHIDHDFYLFIAKDDFKKQDDGSYKKGLDIERMIKITPDEKSINMMVGLQKRSLFQIDSKLYNIWLPKEYENEISGKSSSDIDDWLLDLIDKYKNKGSDSYGKKIYDNVKKRRNNIKKYNLNL